MKKQKIAARSGILAGGNWIMDQVKMVDVYPQREQLANIRSQSEGTGGAPFNVLVDLAKMKAPIALSAVGLVGKDSLGKTGIERQHSLGAGRVGKGGGSRAHRGEQAFIERPAFVQAVQCARAKGIPRARSSGNIFRRKIE